MTISNEDVLIVPTNQVMQVEEAITTTNNNDDPTTAASLTFGVAVVEAIGEGEGGIEVLQPPPQEQQQCNDPNAGEHDDDNAGVSTHDGKSNSNVIDVYDGRTNTTEVEHYNLTTKVAPNTSSRQRNKLMSFVSHRNSTSETEELK